MIYPKNQIIELKGFDDLKLLAQAADKDTKISWDNETTGLGWPDLPFMMTWFAADQGFVMDKRRVNPLLWKEAGRLTLLQPHGEFPRRTLVGSNVLFDLLMGRKEFGYRFTGRIHDTKIQAFLLDENRSTALKNLSEALWPGANSLETEVKKWMEDRKLWPHYDQVPFELMSHYAVQDTYLSHKLDDVQRPLVEALCKSLYDTECELSLVLADMRHSGVRVDVPYLQELQHSMEQELKLLEPQIFGLAGEEFDVMSSTELQRIFYEKLHEPVKFMTEGGEDGSKAQPSTDKEALQNMQHPLGKLMLEHRDRTTSLNTFIKPWLQFVDPAGYLHPELNQTGTKAGRFSSKDPNVQQIPKRSKSAKKLRKAFIFPDGRVGLACDQCQMEMVGFAHYCADTTMRQALIAGKDLHKVTAIEARIAEDEETCTGDQRKLGKGMNFAIVYGCGAPKLGSFLSQDMYAGRHVGPAEAAELRMKYHKRFPGVGAFTQRVIATIRSRPDHSVTNMFGRRMHLPPVFDKKKKKWSEKAYVGPNRLVQSWAADAMKRSMVMVWRYAQHNDVRLYVNVHDELKTHCLEKHWSEHAREVGKLLTDCPGLSVPIRVETTFSRTNWAEEVEVKDFQVPA